MNLGEQNAHLAPEEIADLGRWYFTQFPDHETASAGMLRYQRELERQQAAWRAAGLGS